MAERWEIIESDDGWAVHRNGAWYSDVTDEADGVGLVRNRRVKQVTVVEADGYRRVRKT